MSVPGYLKEDWGARGLRTKAVRFPGFPFIRAGGLRVQIHTSLKVERWVSTPHSGIHKGLPDDRGENSTRHGEKARLWGAHRPWIHSWDKTFSLLPGSKRICLLAKAGQRWMLLEVIGEGARGWGAGRGGWQVQESTPGPTGCPHD